MTREHHLKAYLFGFYGGQLSYITYYYSCTSPKAIGFRLHLRAASHKHLEGSASLDCSAREISLPSAMPLALAMAPHYHYLKPMWSSQK